MIRVISILKCSIVTFLKFHKPLYLEHSLVLTHLMDLIHHFLTHNVNYKKKIFNCLLFLSTLVILLYTYQCCSSHLFLKIDLLIYFYVYGCFACMYVCIL